ncbi:hypothetical protein BDN67DRAFT_1059911 [Paxillus ammoniavirescens]|nr:hypothetical protein BDN67DRAFT_1059911 [Paxillus ammoniavirescens]
MIRNEIIELVLKPSARIGNEVYTSFLDTLEAVGFGRNLGKLSQVPNAAMPVYIHAHPGYYGSKGAAIIESTIMQIVDPKTTPTDSIAPLSLSRFTHYFLVPFVGSHLIAHDLGCDFKTACCTMIASATIGESLHPAGNNNDGLEEVLKANIEARMREHRKDIAERRKILEDEVAQVCQEEARREEAKTKKSKV